MHESAVLRPLRFGLPDLGLAAYAWLQAVAFGLVIVDILYAGSLAGAVDSAVSAGIFNEISDFLQWPLVLLVLGGGLASVVVRAERLALRLVLASWLLLLAGIPLAMLFGPALDATGTGPLLRLALTGSASVLALAGLIEHYRVR